VFKIFLGITPPCNPILVENVNVWGVQSIMIFCEGLITVTHYKKIKLCFGMHPQLINLDLQEGLVIKGM